MFVVLIYDRPVRRISKPVAVPTEVERKEYLKEAEQFTKSLRRDCDNPLGNGKAGSAATQMSGSHDVL